MKSLFMLLMLFVITDPVLAAQPDSPAKCLHKYRTQLNDLSASEVQPQALLLYFSNMCMPEAARSEDPQYFKLLQIMDDDEPVITIEAGLSRQGLMNS